MKWVLSIVGVLLILIGAVWFFQGINVIMGSMMSGHPLYSVLGVIVAAFGGALIYFANRRGK